MVIHDNNSYGHNLPLEISNRFKNRICYVYFITIELALFNPITLRRFDIETIFSKPC